MDTPTEHWWGKLPRLLKATAAGCERISDALDWQPIAEDIGQDGGLVGLFDVARFQDTTVVPSGHKIRTQEGASDARWLWYSFVREIIGREHAAVVPYGAVVHWDGGMDVHSCASNGEVLGIRLSIAGWPDAI